VVLHVTNPELLAVLSGQDASELCITSAATVTADPPPTGAFVLPGVEGVAVVVGKAKGQKCARSWRITEDVGSDPHYPDLSARDARAVREIDSLRAKVA